MFGYTLKIMKKKDIQQAETFERTVISLYDALNRAMKWIKDEDGNENDIRILRSIFSDISAYVDIYINNKFSVPSGSSSLSTACVDMAQIINKLEEMVRDLNMINSELEDCDETVGDNFSMKTKYDKLLETAYNAYKKSMIILDMIVSSMINTINNDYVKIKSGVDIIDDYKRMKKQYKNQTFGIHYEYHIISPQDVAFATKMDKVKNGGKNNE